MSRRASRGFVLWFAVLVSGQAVAMEPKPGAQSSFAPPPELAELAQQVSTALADEAARIDPSHYDVEALAESLDFEIERAVRFVADDIAFDPYLGVMRGADGTLSAGAGSAWDQAVLLASLIRWMAGEAMIVEGTLGKDAAERMLELAMVAPNLETEEMDEDRLLEKAGAILGEEPAQSLGIEAASAQQEFTRAQAEIAGEIARIQENLVKEVAASGRALAGESGTENLKSSLAAHYAWVRYREAPGDEWIDVHPVFGLSSTPAAEPIRFHDEQVPDELLHRLELRLEIERQENQRFRREAIMTPYDRPVANLARRQHQLVLSPTHEAPGDAPDGVLYVPMLNGALAPGARAFNSLGLTSAAQDALAGPAVFETAGRKVASAAGALDGALGGDATTSAVPRLSGVILTVTHRAPGSEAVSEERRLLDLRPGSGVTLERASQVSAHTIVDVGIGRVHEARTTRAALLTLSKRALAVPYLAALSRGIIDEARAMQSTPSREAQLETPWVDLLFARNGFEAATDEESRLIRIAPLVVVQRTHLAPTRTVIDIMHHRVLGLRSTGQGIIVDPQLALTQGVRETVFEHALLHGALRNPWFATPVLQPIASQDALDAFLANHALAPGLADRLRADFAHAGLLLLSPAQDSLRWWRINTASGETLGMGLHGGTEFAESDAVRRTSRFLLMIGIAVTAKGGWDCEQQYEDNDRMRACCHVGNLAMFAAGYGAGSAVGGAVARSNVVANAYNAGVGYFTTMLMFELNANAVGFWGGGAVTTAVCKGLTGG